MHVLAGAMPDNSPTFLSSHLLTISSSFLSSASALPASPVAADAPPPADAPPSAAPPFCSRMNFENGSSFYRSFNETRHTIACRLPSSLSLSHSRKACRYFVVGRGRERGRNIAMSKGMEWKPLHLRCGARGGWERSVLADVHTFRQRHAIFRHVDKLRSFTPAVLPFLFRRPDAFHVRTVYCSSIGIHVMPCHAQTTHYKYDAVYSPLLYCKHHPMPPLA